SDPVFSRNASVNDLEYPPPASGSASALQSQSHLTAQISTSALPQAAIGTGNGAFTGDLAATRGIIGMTKFSIAGWLGTQVTSFRTSTPAAAPRPRACTSCSRGAAERDAVCTTRRRKADRGAPRARSAGPARRTPIRLTEVRHWQLGLHPCSWPSPARRVDPG